MGDIAVLAAVGVEEALAEIEHVRGVEVVQAQASSDGLKCIVQGGFDGRLDAVGGVVYFAGDVFDQRGEIARGWVR